MQENNVWNFNVETVDKLKPWDVHRKYAREKHSGLKKNNVC